MRQTRKCTECNRNKERHLWLAKEWKKKKEAICKSCYKKSISYQDNLDALYRRKFHITLEEYNALLEEQHNKCFVCHKKPGKRRLAVDHDHKKEVLWGTRDSIRGLLCHNCNDFIGKIGDSSEAASRLVLYLTRPAWTKRTGR